MKLASKPQARELVIKHCLPAQIQCNFSDQASRSRAPTCFPATHCLVLQTTFSPQYWTKHPCSVGSGESVAVDLLHSLVGKCWEGISWLPWGEKSYMRSILKVFQVTGKPDCLEGNNQKSIRMSARHLVIIIRFFFSCCTTALTPHLCMTGLCMEGMGTENLNPSLISAPHLPFGLKQDIHNLIYPLLKVSWGLIRPRFINNTFYMQHCTAYSQHNDGPGGKWQCSPPDRFKVSWGLLQWGLLRWLTIMTPSK